MEAQPNPGASGLGGAPRYGRGIPSWDMAEGALSVAMRPMVQEPAQAAIALISRCANHALTQQIQHAYSTATQARDYARAAAAIAATDFPAGPARTALLAILARHEADGERLMREVLRFGREHGRLAFAFPLPV